VTKPAARGGLGFDATWYVKFYHNLIGDSDMAGDAARLLRKAGEGGEGPLPFAQFAGVLYNTRYNKIVFHESHDEAGNAGGTARTLVTAVNGAPLLGDTRRFAEARARLAFGLSILSAGTPMFFMGEEIGAAKPYTYDTFIRNREDILAERSGTGAGMFRFYQEIITLCRRLRSIRSHNIDILHQHDANRVIVFKRWSADEEVIIFASLNNAPFANGYTISGELIDVPNAAWKEVFNSDAAAYGGQNVGNAGALIPSGNGQLNVKIPANGLVVFVKQ
jgi:1,4-alpha-glucan branching enzyme